MARVRPFAGWRFSTSALDISALTAPPYDVISPDQRALLLAQEPHNVVALELPEGPLDPSVTGNRYENGALTWNAWRAGGVLIQDEAPMIYVLAQRYSIDGRTIVRKALICELALEPFDSGIVLPHERTLPKALGDRFELIKSTAANLSQVFGLFEDSDRASDAVFAAAMTGDPIATAVDADGVESTLWASKDADLATQFAQIMERSRVFIADGHHRYTTSLAYRDMRRESEPGNPLDPEYDFVMMALINMDDPDLEVLPTHRVADAPERLDASAFLNALSTNFDLRALESESPGQALQGHVRPAFVIKTRASTQPTLAVLREDVDLETAIPLERSSAWKGLDVAVLQELVLDPLLGIHPDRPDTLDRLMFVKSDRDALESVPDHDVAFVMRPTMLDQLREVALCGETMPQKSTYFYPKLLSGMVLRSAR